MLRLRLRSNARGQVISIKARGHLSTAPHGRDIACAGASTIIQNSALNLHFLNLTTKFHRSPGLLKLHLKRTISAHDEMLSKFIIHSMIFGLMDIQRQYPGKIKIKCEGRRPRL